MGEAGSGADGVDEADGAGGAGEAGGAGRRDPAVVAEFVERFAAVLVDAGFPRMPARVFTALLTSDSGRLTSAELAKVKLIGLDLQLRGQAVLVQVADHDKRPPVPQNVDTDAEGGRGLFLAEHMSSQWGYYHPPTGGKIVWAEVRPSTAPKLRPATAESPPANRAGRPRPFKPMTDEQLPAQDPQLMGRVLVGLRGY